MPEKHGKNKAPGTLSKSFMLEMLKVSQEPHSIFSGARAGGGKFEAAEFRPK